MGLGTKIVAGNGSSLPMTDPMNVERPRPLVCIIT